MRKIILILTVIGVALITCNTPSNNDVEVKQVNCEKPSDIPDTLITGETIDWDCNWQSSYNSGKVKMVKDGLTGGVKMIYRTR